MSGNLFSYGILQDAAIMQSVIGRAPPAAAAVLGDHRAREVMDEVFPGLVAEPGCTTSGTLYSGLSPAELSKLDAFEGTMYQRTAVRVELVGGGSAEAEVYLFRPAYRHLLTEQDWSFARFIAEGRMGADLNISMNPYAEPETEAAVLNLLDTYARDPMGGGLPLPDYTRRNLLGEMRKRPWITVWLARYENLLVGMLIALEGFSTFAARPLLNIHDVIVRPEFRGRGVGRALLREAERVARSRGYVKLTLEVLEGNARARSLYRQLGFTPYLLDPDLGKAEFWEKLL